jgi:predicted AlkP superfamily pyrophosphatase or phosphodiesterase
MNMRGMKLQGGPLRAARAFVLLAIALAAMACGGRPGTGAASAASAAQPASPPAPQRVLLISLDGFRWDYVDRAPAVRLRELAARGVRADRMIPAFPSQTFPNHYTIVTGLTPEEHGIVANVMRDPALGLFHTSDVQAQREPRWWGGEPIWVTAEKQGRRAGSLFWPGSEARIDGVAPTWTRRYQHDLPHRDRTDGVLAWLALPADSAPAVITLYFSDTDDAGHWFGPDAVETDSAIARVDRAVGTLVDGVARLGLTDVVNMLIVADHGMAPVSRERVIVLDELIDLSTAEIVDWTPVAAIAPRAGDEERVYAALRGRHPHLQVYRKGEVPARYHFNDHPRITPIVAVADEGWSIASRAQVARWDSTGWTGGGAHGYDPELISMGAVFIAAGPGIAEGRRVPPFRNIHVYPLMAHLLGLVPARTSGSLDSVRAMLR